MGDISDKKTVVRPPDNASVKATDKVVDNSANREGSVNGELGAMPRAELPSKKTVVGEKIETEGVSVKIKPTERLTSPVLPPALVDHPKDKSAKHTPKHLSDRPGGIP